MMMGSKEEVSDSKGPSCQMDEGPTTTSNVADPDGDGVVRGMGMFYNKDYYIPATSA
eukprot:CAMPEP_0198140294 /NCGR_PEP_ID=MMETSP1443-20131203/3476_1 /TAXON_ID=186043 /ORGANISM="Entomoneis sp., Strain CCMP2396" /LENGTH=56 /DNA_ID=CAMNT_0043802667 /DNA_START=640 /DNA_END=811 /DNA_ORIENTATION=+